MPVSPQFILIALALQSLISATLTAALGSAFGRDGYAWFFLGLIFGIFALAAVAMMGRPPSPEIRPGRRECPACYFEIPAKASRCGHCTSAVEPLL